MVRGLGYWRWGSGVRVSGFGFRGAPKQGFLEREKEIHQIISMMKWIQTSRFSIKNSLSRLERERDACVDSDHSKEIQMRSRDRGPASGNTNAVSRQGPDLAGSAHPESEQESDAFVERDRT